MNKSEIKKAFKEAKQAMGVYGIRNIKENTVFVGAAVNLPAIINRHKSELKFGSHRNKDLMSMWKRCGVNDFSFDILDELEPDENENANPEKDLQVLKDMWVKKLEKEGISVIHF